MAHLKKWRDKIMYLGLKNAEGYYDLTAYEAIKNVTAEERRKKAIYILSLSCSKKSKSKKRKAVRS